MKNLAASECLITLPAERQLAEVEVQVGFPLLLLKLLSDNNADMTLRFAGALYFKNYIKRHWVPVRVFTTQQQKRS